MLGGGGGASEGRGGAGGGAWAGGRGGARGGAGGGGAGGTSLSPVPFSSTGEASAGSSSSTEPWVEKEDSIILLSNHVELNQEPGVVSSSNTADGNRRLQL